MPFTLENWNMLISRTLDPQSQNFNALTDDSIQNLIEESDKEKEKVRTCFLEGILERPKVKDKQLYIKLNQSMLIRLLDKLFAYRKNGNLDERIIKLYESVSQNLETILDFIEDFFGNYFDKNEKVPMSYLTISIDELYKQVDLVRKAVEQRHPYIHAIADILITNFDNFCIQKKGGASYNELIYQKDLISQLLTDNTLDSENSIKEVLFYFNYNDDNYVAYLYEKLKSLTESVALKSEKISALRFAQKNFNQLPVRLDCSFSCSMPSLKHQVNHWIEEEIKFLECEHSLSQKKVNEPSAKSEVYVHVPFKGTEIYVLLKSYIDSGGAPAETYKSLFEKTGIHLSNKNQKGFSTESLQKASDKINYTVKEDAKRFLQKMMRNIDSY
jgi:hypothetical protein